MKEGFVVTHAFLNLGIHMIMGFVFSTFMFNVVENTLVRKTKFFQSEKSSKIAKRKIYLQKNLEYSRKLYVVQKKL